MIQELEQKLDYETFKDKLGSWCKKLRPFIEGKEMWDIYQKLKEDSKTERILPDSKNTFRSFKVTDINSVKVVFYLLDPYPRLYKGGIPQATGIPMDCTNSPTGKLQPSLEKWFEGVSSDIGKKVIRTADLEYLCEQGVLLLNTELTVKKDKTASHEGLWEPFQKYLLEEVLGSDTHIIYVLCGKVSQRMERYINPFCKIFKIEHPAAASHKHTDWETKGVFTIINQILKENNTDTIMWDKDDWEAYKEPPF